MSNLFLMILAALFCLGMAVTTVFSALSGYIPFYFALPIQLIWVVGGIAAVRKADSLAASL